MPVFHIFLVNDARSLKTHSLWKKNIQAVYCSFSALENFSEERDILLPIIVSVHDILVLIAYASSDCSGETAH